MNILRNSYNRVVSVVLFVLALSIQKFAFAQTWQVVTDPGFTISQSNPLYDRRTRSYSSTVTITNESGEAWLGDWRLVINESNKTVSSPDGMTEANLPYFNFIEQGQTFENGASYAIDLIFTGGRGQLYFESQLENKPVPLLAVSTNNLNFGDVTLETERLLSFEISNGGKAPLEVESISSDSSLFTIYPPTSFEIQPNGASRQVQVGFSPESQGSATANLEINSNAGSLSISLSGNGIEPDPELFGEISSDTILDFGELESDASSIRRLTLSNIGDAPLTVNQLNLSDAQFQFSLPIGTSLPFILSPTSSIGIELTLMPNAETAGSIVSGSLAITSDDPNKGNNYLVSLTGQVLPPIEPLVSSPILSARILESVISSDNCSNLSGELQLIAQSLTDDIEVSVVDQGGNSVDLAPISNLSNTERYEFSELNLCSLDDGLLTLKVNYGNAPTYIGTPIPKNTSSFAAPILDAVEPVTIFSHVEVCGTSRESTTVTIEGGSSPVAVELDATTTAFCLEVPLKQNTDNTLITSAVDNLAAIPKPKAIAEAVVVTQVNPSDIIIAEASSRPLTTEEVETLVENGVIDLDDPANFNVSIFTIVLTIGEFPVTYSEPVAVPVNNPGTTVYSNPVGGGFAGGGGSGGGGSTFGGCTSNCSQVIAISTPTGETIPGIIIIEGRIKTLKEFFQVTIAIQNASTSFDLIEMNADIQLPAGLSPVKAGVGTDVSTINTESAVDTIDLGTVDPGETGVGQFIIRGDAIGTHSVDVLFDGFLAGGAITDPIPVSGSAGTSVQVFGPPEFDVTVRHPSRVGEPDVLLNEIYDLVVEIKNTSSRPAHYASLQLFVGGDTLLVDENDDPIPESNEIKNYGHILPGQTVSSAFRVKSLVQGEIIACQAIAAENLSLSVDTGPDGTDCNVANTYPANFEPLLADLPPQVIGINPLNGQPGIPVTTSVFATLTPQAECIIGDTFTNIVLAPIDPLNLSKGDQVVSATLATPGTFYIEELDVFGNAVRRIPTDLTVEHPPAGGTTIAALRLGLPAPHLSQFFLNDNPATQYRVTMVGGDSGICSKASGATMANSFTWTFSTEQVCNALNTPTVSMAEPDNNSIDRPINQPVTLSFSNNMSPQTLSFVPFDLAASSFSIYQGATEQAGDLDLTSASPIPGAASFDGLNRLLTFTPSIALDPGTQVHIRLTDNILDACGNPLQTAPNGVKLFGFETEPLDTTSPEKPSVSALEQVTNQRIIQVSGQAEPNSTITVEGGEAPVTTTTADSGLFSALVPLNLDQQNNLSVVATDASGNASDPTTVSTDGNPLTITNDSIAPFVVSIQPADNATNISRDIVVNVELSEAFNPASLNNLSFVLSGSVIAGDLAVLSDKTFSFTPHQPLDYNKEYTVIMSANGLEDIAGNKLGAQYTSKFATESFPIPQLTSLSVSSAIQGASLQVTFVGTNLATTSDIISDNSGISGVISTATDTEVIATINVAGSAITGLSTLGLQTLGGTASLPFTVLDKAPTISSIVPNSLTQGDTISARINGSGLANVISISQPASGVTVTILNAGNDGHIDVQISAAVNASIGTHPLTVTTPGGTASTNVTVSELLLAPVITDLSPNNALQGSSFTATFTGMHLANASAIVSTNPGVSGNILTNSDTTITAQITVANNATPGVMQLGIATAAGTDTAVFTVEEPALPPIISDISPKSGNQGTKVNATISGQNLMPVIGLSSSCPSINLIDLGTGNSGSLNVEIDIADDAAIETCQITVTTIGGSDQVNFDVTAAPKTLSFDPEQAQLLTSSTLTIQVQLNAPAPVGGIVVDLMADDANISLPATVTIAEGSTAADILLSAAKETGIVNIEASASGLQSDNIDVEVLARDFTLYSPLVGIDRTVSATISLDEPAPSGGANFDLAINDANIATLSTNTIFIPEGQSTASFNIIGGLVTGITSISADGIADGYLAKSLDISVTDRLIDLPAAQNLSLGSEQVLNILIAPDPAPPGGVEITIESSDASLVEILTPTVVIPEGKFQAEATIKATGGSTGMATVTASNTGFAPDTTQVNVSAGLNIIETAVTVEPPATQTIHFELTSGGEHFAAPAGGTEIIVTSSNENCIAVTSPVTVNEGESFASATLSYGNIDNIPCTSTITAANSIFGSDTLDVTVDNVPDIASMNIFDNWWGDYRIGESLQAPYSINLASSAHSGVTVNISSNAPSKALVSSNQLLAGSASISVFIPAGQTNAIFYVQGIADSSGPVTLSASTPQFTSVTRDIDVVKHTFQIRNLSSSTTTLSNNDPFQVRAGYIHSNGSTFRYANVSAAHGDLTVELASSDDTVGLINKTTGDAASQTVTVRVNSLDSASSVANGGVAFDPIGAGTTTISASTAKSDTNFSGSSLDVAVSQPSMNVFDNWWGDYRIGGGLQAPYSISLGAPAHGGVTIEVSSDAPDVLLLANSATESGSSTISIDIPDGQTTATFYVQGGFNKEGSATISATTSVFPEANRVVEVVKPVLQVRSLSSSTTSLSNNDPFQVRSGYIHSNGSTFRYANISATAGDLTVNVASSDDTVGLLNTLSGDSATQTITIKANSLDSPSNVASGGIAFNPVGGGSTTISASATAYDTSYAGSQQTVTVSQPSMSITDNWWGDYRLGSGQQAPYRINLGAPAHGGVTIELLSDKPSVATLSVDANTAGSDSISISIPDGQTNATFYVQGVVGATDSFNIKASTPLFSDVNRSVEVVQPVLAIASLSSSRNSLASNDPFVVRSGYIHSNGSSFRYAAVSAAAGNLSVNLNSSDDQVGVLVTSSGTSANQALTISTGAFSTPSNVASGGVEFDPVGGGTTTISASASGYDNSYAGRQLDVTVTQPTMSLTDNWWGDYRIGSGLQAPYRVNLGASAHGGVTIEIGSNNPSLVSLSDDANSAGTATLSISIPDGQSNATFYVQGLAGQTGDVELTATTALFSDASRAISVTQPVLSILNLSSSTTSLSNIDDFYVRTGYVHSNGSSFRYAAVSAIEGDLTVNLGTNNTGVGLLNKTTGDSTTQSVTVPVGAFNSPTTVASGGVGFKPVGSGTTTISASATGYNDTFAGSQQTVSVSQPSMTISDNVNGDTFLGGGLQERYRVTLGAPAHGGVTVRVSSSQPGIALVSESPTTAGTAFIDIFIADGQTVGEFYVHGINGITGSSTLTASNTLFVEQTANIEIVQSVINILNLSTSISAAANDDTFNVYSGYLNGSGQLRYANASSQGDIQVLVSSSDESVGQLKTITTQGKEVVVSIPINQQFSPSGVGNGGIAFDPLTAGSTVISTQVNGFNNGYSGSSKSVTVNQ